jgi:hypothetical protein
MADNIFTKSALDFMPSITGKVTRKPSLVEFAELCRAVYGDASSVSICTDTQTVIWKRDKYWQTTSFFAAVYTREANGRVLAFRGTNLINSPLGDTLGDLNDDAAIFFGDVPTTATLALQIPSFISQSGLYLTGHSLGGALAIIVAACYGLPAVTFNAPGVMDSCTLANSQSSLKNLSLRQLIASVGRCFSGSRMLNIRIDGDPISSFWTTGFQSGVRRVEYARQCSVIDGLCRHGIDACVSAVRKRSDGFQEISI